MSRDLFPTNPYAEAYWDTIFDGEHAQDLRPVYFVEAFFPDGSVERLCTFPYDVNAGYDVATYVVWTGAGDLMSISKVDENGEMKSTNIQIQIRGMNEEWLQLALDGDYSRMKINVYFSFDIGNGYTQVYADTTLPPLAFSGYVDNITLVDTGSEVVTNVNVESKVSDFNKSPVKRYSNADFIDFAKDTEVQKYVYPTGWELDFYLQDTSMQWTSVIQKRVLEWKV